MQFQVQAVQIGTYPFCNLDKSIWRFGEIYFVILSNTYCKISVLVDSVSAAEAAGSNFDKIGSFEPPM